MRYGGAIEAGQLVLAGFFIRPIEARHGDTIVADYGPHGGQPVLRLTAPSFVLKRDPV